MADIFGWGLANIELNGFAHLAGKVGILSVTPYEKKIRVVFDRGMLKNDALTKISNYTIIRPTTDDVQPIINSIITENVIEPTWIEINCTEHTIGSLYQLAIATVNGPTDPELMPIDLGSTPQIYTGIGEIPTISTVESISSNLIKINFSEPMLDERAIREANNYSFDKGLIAVDVLNVDSEIVTIITSNQTPGELYTVTITQPGSDKFQDLAFNQLITGSTSQFLGYETVIEVEILDLEMYRFLTNSIRLEDLQNGLFLKRFLQGFQEIWKTTHTSIFSLKNLWNILAIPDRLLQHMKNIVGWTDDLSDITDQLDYDTLRKLISISIAFWKDRGVESTTISILELLTQAPCRIWNWFDFRWIIDVTQLGEEHQGRDPHIIDIPGVGDSEYHSNLRITDDGYLNRQLVESIMKLTRPVGERITVHYLKILERFTYDAENWIDLYDPGIIDDELIYEDGIGKMENSTYFGIIRLNWPTSYQWQDYVAYSRIKGDGVEFGMGVYVTHVSPFLSHTYDGFLALINVNRNQIKLAKKSGSSVISLQTVSYSPWGILQENVWYGLRMHAYNYNGTTQLSVYVDNNLIAQVNDSTFLQGSIGFIHSPGSTVQIDEVEAFNIPGDIKLIDINP